jgi:hypothetical protein
MVRLWGARAASAMVRFDADELGARPSPVGTATVDPQVTAEPQVARAQGNSQWPSVPVPSVVVGRVAS